jgi:hypothetical protein
MPEITAPPKWIMFLLWPFRGETCYPQVEGDLSEEFQHRVSKSGIAGARRWYHREVCRNLLSLTWRWATIAAVVSPLICDAIRGTVNPPFMRMLSTLWQHPQPKTYFILLIIFVLSKAIPGLASGIVCSSLLRGHGRMIRLSFTGYYLGLWAFWVIQNLDVYTRGNPLVNPECFIPLLGQSRVVGFGQLEPVWILAFIFYGSIWLERRRSRQTFDRIGPRLAEG